MSSEPKPVIETARLRLRPFHESDADDLVVLDADPEVRRYVHQPDAPTRKHFLETVFPRWRERERTDPALGFWIAERRDTDERAFLGWFHLKRPTADTPSQPGDLELGYRLRRDAWGRGFATEGSRALLDHAFCQLDAPRVIAAALAGNAASLRVMAKCGLHQVAEWEIPGEGRAVLRAIERDAWRARDEEPNEDRPGSGTLRG